MIAQCGPRVKGGPLRPLRRRGVDPDAGASPFEQQNIPPPPRKPAQPLTPPEVPKAGALVNPDAALVLREDARLQRPDPGPFGRLDERGQ